MALRRVFSGNPPNRLSSQVSDLVTVEPYREVRRLPIMCVVKVAICLPLWQKLKTVAMPGTNQLKITPVESK